MTTFEAGKTYSARSICDSNCIFSFTVVSRTAKRLMLKGSDGKLVQRGVYVAPWEPNTEKCKPLGSYSMCPVISADKAGA